VWSDTIDCEVGYWVNWRDKEGVSRNIMERNSIIFSIQRWKIVLAVFAVLVILPLPTVALPSEFTGKVVGVAKGDSITVLRNGKGERIRLNGIECPELRQAFGQRAKELTSSLAFGKTVTVKPVGRDKHGRTVAVVTLPDGRYLHFELIKAGLAWWFSRTSIDERLSDLQEEARLAKRGLWVDPNPIPPWEWRHRMEPINR
jgi:micrococcal nuclease